MRASESIIKYADKIKNEMINRYRTVLECDGRQRLALSLDLHVLLRLDCLVQTITVASARHDTSGKFIDDQDLIILDHIVLVAVHRIMRAQRKDDTMLDLH